MKALQVKFESTEFPNEVLDRFLFALNGRMNELFQGGFEQPVTASEAIEYSKVSETTFYRLVKSGVIEPFYYKGLTTPLYLRSQIFKALTQNKSIPDSLRK
jgi:hypothetical protein